jgi:hypothetical protein
LEFALVSVAYNARLNSTLGVQNVSLDLLSLTATVRGISIAERGQTPLVAPIYVRQARAKVRLWPLLQRRIVVGTVSASEASVRLDIDRRHRVNLEEPFRLLADKKPGVPSPWNVIIRQFKVDSVTLELSVEGQPLRTTLQHMTFPGSMTLTAMHIRTAMLEGQGEVSPTTTFKYRPHPPCHVLCFQTTN